MEKHDGSCPGWVRPHRPSRGPSYSLVLQMSQAPPVGTGQLTNGRGCASLVDLRVLPPNESPIRSTPTQWRAMIHAPPPPLSQVPMIPRRPQMGISAGQRVFSMEALNGQATRAPFGNPGTFLLVPPGTQLLQPPLLSVPARPPFVPEPRMLAAQIERMQLQKWRSQDSGIGT